MINQLAHSPTRSKNFYFANNEQESIAVFTTVFYFTHADHNLIKLKLYNNSSVQAVNRVLCEIQRNQSNLLTFKKLANQSTLNNAHVMKMTKAFIAFMTARNPWVA